jgi:CheY-like chemotaxis protein
LGAVSRLSAKAIGLHPLTVFQAGAVGDSFKRLWPSRSAENRKICGQNVMLTIDQKIVQKNLESQLGTVLLVDDDVDIRLLTKLFLNNFGYEVDCANSASEALARFDPALHDLVLTDNTMPGMTGGEMAHVIKLRSPSTIDKLLAAK